ncbi:hypothetical protein [Hydrocarboniclastica marina]|uniref:Glycine zipper domain-containing protein n=1 Tax=Hydrocarboniclastica marina TaxID=2259620 RepID=A0A4P7XHI6_9ALTE|nr:hypothetical protein [Hydrocarboniclastica marina]QCF26123.1 hypothetical protein soil367_09370 [Hydrocarboniclastica marina]
MPPQCPLCQSLRIGKNNYGKKTAGVVDTSAGVIGGFTAVASGARAGVTLGLIAGPAGGTIGGIGGAIIGGLLGGVTGATAGVTLGRVIDEKILDNLKCVDCGFNFSTEPEPERSTTAE